MPKGPCVNTGCKPAFSQVSLESFEILNAIQSLEFRLELITAMTLSPTFQVIFVSAYKGHTVTLSLPIGRYYSWSIMTDSPQKCIVCMLS